MSLGPAAQSNAEVEDQNRSRVQGFGVLDGFRVQGLRGLGFRGLGFKKSAQTYKKRRGLFKTSPTTPQP